MSSAVALGCVITVVVLSLLRPLAPRIGLIDLPDTRKCHAGAVPLVGGLAIYSGFVLTCLLLQLGDRQLLAFIWAGGLLLAVGALDDRQELSPVARLIAQAAAALILCFNGVVVESLGELVVPGHELKLGSFAVPFTVFAVVALINATNMSDGVDGLAGSQTLISLTGLVAVAAVGGIAGLAAPLAALCGALGGFLIFNMRSRWRPRAAVFLGDAGSNFLGLGLAWALISLTQSNPSYVIPAAALWFVSLQVFDTIEVVTRRVLRRRSPFEADREHLHHVFLLAGFSVSETVFVMALVASGSVIVGVLAVLLQPPQGAVFFGFVLSGVVFLRVMLRTWRTMTFMQRSICRRKSRPDRRRTAASAWVGTERRSGIDRRRFIPQVSGVPASAPPQADTGKRLAGKGL